MLSDNSDTIRQGFVSRVNYEEGMICVTYPDKNNMVTAELPLLAFEYDMPRVGDQVYVAHQSNGVEKGIALSRYFHENEKPVEYGPHIWRKEFRDDSDSFIKFDRNTHTLTINIADSQDISINIIAAKDVTVKSGGNIKLEAEGSIALKSGEPVTFDAPKIYLNER